MELVFTIEPKCLNPTQLQVRLHVEDVRVNVTVRFLWVITSLQCDKVAVWWVGTAADGDRGSPSVPAASHRAAK